MARVLVIRLGAIGDLVVTLPALAALRQVLPRATIELIANPAPASLLRGQGLVDRIMTYDQAVADGLGPAADVDLAVLWTNDPDAVLVGALRSIRIRQMIHGEPPRRETQTPPHAVDRLLAPVVDALARLDPRLAAVDWLRVPQIQPTAADRAAAAALWASHAPKAAQAAGAPIVVHPGSGSPQKNWPVERYAAVVDALLKRGQVVALVLGPADEAVGAALRGHLWMHRQTDRLVWLPPAPLPVLAAFLAGARVFLGNDSGISHLAAAVGAPTVAIFGPTEPAVWAPRGRHVRVLRAAASSAATPPPADAWVDPAAILAALDVD